VRVIPPGIDRTSAATAPAPRSPPALRRIILNRRHVVTLIRAVAAVAREVPDVSLDLVGDNRTFPHEDIDGAIANHGVGGRSAGIGVIDDQLRDLYARPRLCIPVECEGSA
jgi:hypothetical protein